MPNCSKARSIVFCENQISQKRSARNISGTNQDHGDVTRIAGGDDFTVVVDIRVEHIHGRLKKRMVRKSGGDSDLGKDVGGHGDEWIG
jgi:hypothetical protein